jgi:flagellar biogenesis protein FliO
MKIALATALVLATATAAAAADGIVVSGSDTEAVVTLHGVHAISPRVRWIGDKIELDVADESPAQIAIPSDSTIKKIEVTGGVHARASLQIKHSSKTTEILGRSTKVIEKGEDLVLRIPRDAKAAAAMDAEPVPVAQPPAPPPAPAPAPAPAPSIAAPAPAPAPTVAAAPAPAPAPPPAVAKAPSAPPLALAESPRLPLGSIAIVCAVGLGGAALWFGKRRRGPAPQIKRTIEIVSSRALGGKTRLVLVAVDDNELLLSVCDNGGARLLSSWSIKDDAAEDDWRAATASGTEDWRAATATPRLGEPLPTPVGIAPPRQIPAATPPAARGTVDLGGRPASRSVSGLLRLKLNAAGSGPHQATDDTTDDDDGDGDTGRDAAWIRELVKAARKGNHA